MGHTRRRGRQPCRSARCHRRTVSEYERVNSVSQHDVYVRDKTKHFFCMISRERVQWALLLRLMDVRKSQGLYVLPLNFFSRPDSNLPDGQCAPSVVGPRYGKTRYKN